MLSASTLLSPSDLTTQPRIVPNAVMNLFAHDQVHSPLRILPSPPRGRLPTEVLLHIINFADITRQDLRNLALTSHVFRSIAQRYLFTTFYVHKKMYGLEWQSEQYALLLEQRITFIISDHIVSSVRKVVLRQNLVGDRPESQMRTVDGTKISSLIFGAFSSLRNIRVLDLEWLIFTPQHLAQLSYLSRLTELHLRHCRFNGTVSNPPRFVLEKLSVGRCGSTPWWAALVRLDKCQELRLSTQDDCKAGFSALEAEKKAFALHTLHLHCSAAFAIKRETFFNVLAKTALVTSLILSYDAPGEYLLGGGPLHILPAHILPHLTSISAPFDFTRILSGPYNRSLQHFTTYWRFNDLHSPRTLSVIHEKFPHLHSIIFHGPEGMFYTPQAFNHNFSLFGYLKVLYLLPRLVSKDDVLWICERIRYLPLPLTLVDLHIGCETISADVLILSKNLTSHVLPCIDQLRNRLPFLKHLLVLAPSEFVEWQNEQCCMPCYVRPSPEWFEVVNLE
ncbi:unnamed protein product [Somion occarium]|uniref:F-box domain-containing protein n=1 Tax=Somion occarium TaxID=3059160 RepID=A0ABP1E6Z5_9APHY